MIRELAILVLSGAVTAAMANPAHEQVSAMSEQQRAGAFTQLLRASGEKCGTVNRTFYQGSTKSGDAVWHLGCSNGQAYALTIKNDRGGSTMILDCKVLAAVKAGKCFSK